MSEINPYKILRVSPAASNAEITKAFAEAMKRKEYPLDAIALARKTLMNPEDRVIADYLQPILPQIQRFKTFDYSALKQPEPQLKLSPEIAELKTYVEDYNNKTLRKKLGNLLFNEEI